jgi:hypothetical protein
MDSSGKVIDNNDEDRTVKIVVFLNESERIRFKVACAEEKTTMSQKSKELINAWLKERETTKK